MSSYCVLGNYTEQGIRTIKDSPKRLDDTRTMAKGMGVELKAFNLAMGAYDFVVMLEAPDDEAVARFGLALGSRGNVRTCTLKLFPEADFRNIIGQLP
jgi:uncharacterized protein with GYD domain